MRDLVGNDPGEEPEASAHPLVAHDDQVVALGAGDIARMRCPFRMALRFIRAELSCSAGETNDKCGQVSPSTEPSWIFVMEGTPVIARLT